jgi:ribosomal protein S18 acetylase RimI-like enzyme
LTSPIPEHVMRFWRSLDAMFGRVEPTRWGAIVTDGRYPAVWDANYARVDLDASDLTLAEVEASLLPALQETGASVQHVVSFHPEATRSLLHELEALGHRLTWDLVMDLVEEPPIHRSSPVDAIASGPELWSRVRESLALFGIDDGATTVQLAAIEREVLEPGGKRWFGVRDDEGTIVSLGALMVLDDVGYIDNVATFEHARGRGFASALAARMIEVAHASGASHVCLFADPDDRPVVGIYERLGFRGAGLLAATRGPVQRAPVSRGDRDIEPR